MASAAVEAELAIVDVVGTMAVGAAASQPHLGRDRPPVTGLARHVAMRAGQLEVGLGVVVELPLQPFHRVVAQSAVIRESACVWIDLGMAGAALGRRVFENMRLVTCIALGVRMLTEPRELRQAVIEKYVFRPGQFVVTVEALFTLRTGMSVVVVVTAQAVARQFHLEDRLDMTGRALRLGMRAVQCAPGICCVVEAYGRPFFRHVAGLTGLAEVPLVVIVLEVTRNAGHIQIVSERVFTVTIFALRLRVASAESEACITPVIELRVGPSGR